MSVSLRTRMLAGALAAALLAGCATSPALLQVRDSPPEVPARTELDSVPFFPQERYQCGPAALATVLVAQGVTVTPQQLEPEVYLPARHGSLQLELVAAARRRGRLVYPLPAPPLSNLIAEVAAGHPVLVMQNLGLRWLPQWHYAVVVGYDLDNELFILRSSTVRRWKTKFALFEKTWARAGYWGLVIVPPAELPPRTATPLAYLRAAYELEAVGESSSAASAYRSAYRRWPEEAAVALAMGNMEYAQGNPHEAEAVFRSALHLHPKHPDLWNNWAYALAARGCYAASREAVQCARRLAPADQNIAESERELLEAAVTSGDIPADCPSAICPP